VAASTTGEGAAPFVVSAAGEAADEDVKLDKDGRLVFKSMHENIMRWIKGER
jgi:hypothetical protein